MIGTSVALHDETGDPPQGGDAYPSLLMGLIAFNRQPFLDAQHYQGCRGTGVQGAGAQGPSTRRRRSHLRPDRVTEGDLFDER